MAGRSRGWTVSLLRWNQLTTPSMSLTCSPASSMAIMPACAARTAVDEPEPRVNSVQPIPVMAVWSRMGNRVIQRASIESLAGRSPHEVGREAKRHLDVHVDVGVDRLLGGIADHSDRIEALLDLLDLALNHLPQQYDAP